MLWYDRGDGNYELVDGLQRVISICEFVRGDVRIRDGYQLVSFEVLQREIQEQILEYKINVFIFTGIEQERFDHFLAINNIATNKY